MDILTTLSTMIITTDPTATMLSDIHQEPIVEQFSSAYEKKIETSTTDEDYTLNMDSMGIPILTIPETSPYISMFDKVERSLIKYANLEEGGDGYDGVAASEETVSSALRLLSKIEINNLKAPSPMLSSSGTIGFYWNKDSLYVQINIKSENMYFEYIENGNEYFGVDNKAMTDPFSEQLISALS